MHNSSFFFIFGIFYFNQTIIILCCRIAVNCRGESFLTTPGSTVIIAQTERGIACQIQRCITSLKINRWDFSTWHVTVVGGHNGVSLLVLEEFNGTRFHRWLVDRRGKSVTWPFTPWPSKTKINEVYWLYFFFKSLSFSPNFLFYFLNQDFSGLK